jgi:hypothetical protein
MRTSQELRGYLLKIQDYAPTRWRIHPLCSDELECEEQPDEQFCRHQDFFATYVTPGEYGTPPDAIAYHAPPAEGELPSSAHNTLRRYYLGRTPATRFRMDGR